MTVQPAKPIASEDVEWTDYAPVPAFGVRYRHLTRAALGDSYRVGVAIEELAPGKRSNPSHYHHLEEEHVFILQGSLTCRIGDRGFPMRAGGYVVFPAGRRAGHYLVNEGDEVCRYVILGENNPNDVVVYPDSNKVLVRSLGRRAMFDIGEARNYWHGEATGLAEGEPLPARAGPRLDLAAQAPIAPIEADRVEWNAEGDGGSRFGGRSRHLTWAALGHGNYHVGVLIESPAPGMRLCPKHYHLFEEEHALILEGEVTLLFGEERIVMKPGDYVCFPAGQKIGHSFLNSGEGPCSYLMIGERNPGDVCVYPDTDKMFVRALDLGEPVFDMGARRGYWDGE